MEAAANSVLCCDEEELLIRQISNLDIRIKQMKKISSMPPNIRMKIEALKKLQFDQLEKEAEFHQKAHLLEVDFQKNYDEINEKRRNIVNGKLEGLLELSDDAADQVQGLPEFWLTVFKMTPVLQAMIREGDEDALRRLIDVRVQVKNDPLPSFVLQFEFEPNDFFNDRTLEKTYLMKCRPNSEKPLLFNGFEIYDTVGHDIDWKDGANLTKKTVEDKDGQKREFKTDSFFNFFNPKALFITDPLLRVQLLETDFEIGYYIKERVIPRATLFYIGEVEDELDDVSDSLEEESLRNNIDSEEVDGAVATKNSEKGAQATI